MAHDPKKKAAHTGSPKAQAKVGNSATTKAANREQKFRATVGEDVDGGSAKAVTRHEKAKPKVKVSHKVVAGHKKATADKPK